jgi:uncharacterized membrane protein (UPF0127 family)
MKPLYKKPKNTSSNILITQELSIADSLWKRLKGLMGTKDLKKNQMLWIQPCNSIHTFFMHYPIDVVFLDRNLVIRSIKKAIFPWRATFPVLRAFSVIEMQSGRADELGLEEGDQLHVGP